MPNFDPQKQEISVLSFLDNLDISLLSCVKLVKCMGMPTMLASLSRFPMSQAQPQLHIVNISFNGCDILSMSDAGHHDEKYFHRRSMLPMNSAGCSLSHSFSGTQLDFPASGSQGKSEKHSDKPKMKHYTNI